MSYAAPLALTDADVARIADAVVTRMRSTEPSGEVLTRTQAMTLSSHRSVEAFHKWCQRHRVKAAFRGRYSRAHLMVALEREGRKRAA